MRPSTSPLVHQHHAQTLRFLADKLGPQTHECVANSLREQAAEFDALALIAQPTHKSTGD